MNVDNTDLTVLLPTVQEVLAEADLEDVRHPEVGLHQGPVGHPAVAGDGVEVEVAVQVVPGPASLPGGLAVLPRVGVAEEGGLGEVGVEVVHGHTTVVPGHHR